MGSPSQQLVSFNALPATNTKLMESTLFYDVTSCKFLYSGLLKRYMLPISNMAFSTKIKGNHHLQGNVQVYNVRIPALLLESFSRKCGRAGKSEVNLNLVISFRSDWRSHSPRRRLNAARVCLFGFLGLFLRIVDLFGPSPVR